MVTCRPNFGYSSSRFAFFALFCLHVLARVSGHGGMEEMDEEDEHETMMGDHKMIMNHGGSHQPEKSHFDSLNRRVLLISLDGFRYDYIEKFLPHPNNFTKFADGGLYSSHGLHNTFLTKTLPNHFTMLTGLYQESHGIYNNVIFDPETGKSVDLFGNSKNDWSDKFYAGEPIDVSAVKFFKNASAVGCSQFITCELHLGGVKMPKVIPFNDTWPFRKSLTAAVDWFAKENVSLGLVYHPEPDEVGHSFGVGSKELNATLERLNDDIGYLLRLMSENGLSDKLNVIITADHGMLNVDGTIHIAKDDGLFSVSVADDMVWFIVPKPGKLNESLAFLNGHLAKTGHSPHARAFAKSDLPERWHYKRNKRLTDIILLAEPGFRLQVEDKTGLDDHVEMYASSASHKGTHGYDNTVPEMHPVFLARGPAFRSQADAAKALEDASLVDLYMLISSVLGIPMSQMAPNNGSVATVQALLKPDVWQPLGLSSEEEVVGITQTQLVVLISCAGAILFSLAMFALHRISKEKGQSYYRMRLPFRQPDSMADEDSDEFLSGSDDEIYSSARLSKSFATRTQRAPRASNGSAHGRHGNGGHAKRTSNGDFVLVPTSEV